MAEGTLKVELCAPERAKQSLEVTEVICPGEEGVFTVLPGHTPLLSLLAPGVVQVFDVSGGEQYFAVSGGFAEVRDNTVIILADAYEPGAQIDLERAVEAQERAERRLKKPEENLDLLRAEMALSRSLARIDAHKGRGHT